MKCHLRHALFALVLLVGLNTVAQAQHYAYRTFDPPGSVDTEPYGINLHGLISGQYVDANGNGYGFVLDGNQFTRLLPSGGSGVTAGGPTESGQVPLTYVDANGLFHSAVWQQGSFTLLPDLPGFSVWGANFLNDAGRIVGIASNDPSFRPSVGFSYSGGSYRLFTVPGAVFFNPTGINDADEITGAYTDSSGTLHGFLKTGDAFVPIDYPNATGTWTYSINNSHVIAGRYQIGNTRHGFLLHAEQYTAIDYPGALSTWATYVNEQGEVVGFYLGPDGNLHGFAATPVD
jgi:hypothetical protein